MKIDNPKVTGELTLVGGGSSTLSGSFSGSFQGDGSGITGIVTASYAENASGQVIETPTVTQSFSNVTSVNVNHGFDTRNVLVSVYDDGFSQFMPDSITLTDTNNVDIEFITQRSGIVVVAKGGHIVSGSTDNAINLDGQPSSFYLDYDNFTNTPTDFSGSFTGSFQGDLEGTSSFATTASYAVSASHEITLEVSSSYAESASYAVTASHVTDVDTTNITAAEKIVFDTTGNEEFGLPAGTTAQRPASPSAGYMRWNSTDSRIEVYNGTRWAGLSEIGFQSETMEVAQLSVTANDGVAENVIPLEVEYLVIAGGGGGGGSHAGGGGGAGGYRSSVSGESSGGGASAESVFEADLSTSYTVTVGAGGAGGTNSTQGANGSNSTFNTFTSIGGGKAGQAARYGGQDGGSGGGGSGDNTAEYRTAGSGTSNQGFAGGIGNNTVFNNYGLGGGGGGASQAGLNAGGSGGNGGDGIQSAVTGTATYRAGGGGGGGWSTRSAGAGAGGVGGGGDGSSTSGVAGDSGLANTGGGGGGSNASGEPNRSGGSGGSGVVILRYPSDYSITVGGGLTSSTTTVGDNKVTTFTAGTDTISFS